MPPPRNTSNLILELSHIDDIFQGLISYLLEDLPALCGFRTLRGIGRDSCAIINRGGRWCCMCGFIGLKKIGYIGLIPGVIIGGIGGLYAPESAITASNLLQYL